VFRQVRIGNLDLSVRFLALGVPSSADRSLSRSIPPNPTFDHSPDRQ
jgi:hypothetical protein